MAEICLLRPNRKFSCIVSSAPHLNSSGPYTFGIAGFSGWLFKMGRAEFKMGYGGIHNGIGRRRGLANPLLVHDKLHCILVGHASRSLGNAVPRSRLRGLPSPFSKAPQLSASAWPLQRESLPPRNRVNRFPVLLLYHPGRSIGRRRRYFEQVRYLRASR